MHEECLGGLLLVVAISMRTVRRMRQPLYEDQSDAGFSSYVPEQGMGP